MKLIIGKKIGSERIFSKEGESVPVTVVHTFPCYVTQIKTKEKEGYDAIQIGCVEKRRLNKAKSGHLKKANVKAKLAKFFEFPIETKKNFNLGDKIDVSIFKEGEKVDVLGVSKGKGFAGTIKRHKFHQGPRTHGSHNIRQPGSIGATGPQRVFKGKKMPGHLGHENVTIKNLEIMRIDSKHNEMLIKGPVSGPNDNLIEIRSKD